MLRKKLILMCLVSIVIANGIFFKSSLGQSDLEFVGLAKIDDPSLIDRVRSYYKLEKIGAWNKTYEFRPKKFWETVPYDVYERIMEEDSSGYDLYKIKIDLIEREYQKGSMMPIIHIWANFYELIADQDKLKGSGFSNIYNTGDVHAASDRVTWVFEDEQWKCAACGIRVHMSMNAQY